MGVEHRTPQLDATGLVAAAWQLMHASAGRACSPPTQKACAEVVAEVVSLLEVVNPLESSLGIPPDCVPPPGCC